MHTHASLCTYMQHICKSGSVGLSPQQPYGSIMIFHAEAREQTAIMALMGINRILWVEKVRGKPH